MPEQIPIRDADEFADLPQRGSPEEKRYFAWVASLPCIITGLPGVQVAHVRGADAWWHKRLPGTGRKPLIPYVVPLSPAMHREQEAGSWAFWERRGFPREPAQVSILFHCWALWRIYRAGLAAGSDHAGGRELACAYIRHLQR